NDTGSVRGAERPGNLNREIESRWQIESRPFHLFAQGFAVNQFGSDKMQIFMLPDVENGNDIRMIESRSGTRFSGESLNGSAILHQVFWQNFDSNLAFKPRIAGAIDLAHAACADRGENFIVTEFCANTESHSLKKIRGFFVWRLGESAGTDDD